MHTVYGSLERGPSKVHAWKTDKTGNAWQSPVVAHKALPQCITVPNFEVIGQSVAEIWRFVDFSRWLRPPARIFKFWKF